MAEFSSNTTPFGLSKHLSIPISVKICYLHSKAGHVASSSKKYKHPSVFQRLLDISANSDLFVRIEVLDGNNNPLAAPVQTPYKAFSGNKRVWNSYVKLPVNYNQVGYDAYIRLTILEIVQTRPVVFGEALLSLFNHTNGTLRKGSYKVPVSSDGNTVAYGDIAGVTSIEDRLIRFENGDFVRTPWLDSMAMPVVEQQHGPNDDDDALYVELPNFSLPIVFLDVTYSLPQLVPQSNYMESVAPTDAPGTTMVINLIDITARGEAKVYDPDFHIQTLQSFNSAENPDPVSGVQPGGALDPIDKKFQTLATNFNNNSLLDKEVKPSPHMRDELWRILRKPASAVLSDHDKKLLWRFRFYFSRAPLSEDAQAAPLQSTRQFLTKFLKCFNWENEQELDHVFTEILPYWTVEHIDIGDALELLGSQFSTHNLTALLRRRIISTAKDVNAAEEKKIEKITKYAMRLRNFAVDRLRLASADELLLYLLQLVQALQYEVVEGEGLRSAPLAHFLIEKAVENGTLGNFFYWYVKVENEDQLSMSMSTSVLPQKLNGSIYTIVMNTYIERLKTHCQSTKQPQYKHLKRQIGFIKRLTGLVELLRTSFKKNEATSKKVQFLQDYLSDPSNELLKFEPFPLPLDPSVIICGCYPTESSVFKSSLSPLKITFKTVSTSPSHSQMFKKSSKHGKYPLMFKIGDDLRQDQLVIQIITLMDQLLKNENLDLRLTPYKILATSPIAGLIQFVPNETLDSVLSKTYDSNPPQAGASIPNTNGTVVNGILSYLQLHSRMLQQEEPEPESVLGKKKDSIPSQQQQHAITTDLGVSSIVMDNYVKSCAGYCVITYLLGVGDRHLDNLLLSPNGKFWHADFGYILGRDPKPFPPLMKLPIQVIDGMGGMDHENFNIFKNYCFITYTTLRRNSNLILNLFQLMLNANIPDIQIDPKRAVEKVQDKFALEMTEEEAILHFQNLIIDSVNAFLPVVIDALHSLAQYWRA